MKNNIFTFLFFLFSITVIAQPANDVCSGAISLGTLPTPSGCGGGTPGVGASVSLSTGSATATAANPYSYILDCGAGTTDMANPAVDVWYKVVASGNRLIININGNMNPQIGFYSGTCTNLTAFGCALPTNTTVTSITATFEPTTPGQTYFIQVSGNNATNTGTYTITANNNNDCDDCYRGGTLTADPPPVNGTYPMGQSVKFCYKVTDYTQVSSNWLHGVQVNWASPGWATTPATAVTSSPSSCSGSGAWNWYSTGIGNNNGSTWPAGYYYDYNPVDGDPRNNYGDNNAQNCDLQFCWTLKTATYTPATCPAGQSLNVTANTSGDGESGDWTSVACQDDPTYNFDAVLSCCFPPTTSSTPVTCANSADGTATATTVAGTAPFDYQWYNSSGTLVGSTTASASTSNTISGLLAGTYTIVVTDNAANKCVTSATAVVAVPPGGITLNAITNKTLCANATTALVSFTTIPAGGIVTWTNSNTSIGLGASGTGNIPSFQALNTGLTVQTAIITATPMTTAGCTGPSQTFSYIVNPSPLVTLTPTQSVCPGQVLTLTGTYLPIPTMSLATFSNTTSVNIPNPTGGGTANPGFTSVTVSGVNPTTLTNSQISSLCFTVKHKDFTELDFIQLSNGATTYTNSNNTVLASFLTTLSSASNASNSAITFCFPTNFLSTLTGNANSTWTVGVRDGAGGGNRGSIIDCAMEIQNTPIYSYSWTPTATLSGSAFTGTTSASSLTIVATPTATTTYNLSITDQAGCSGFGSAVLTTEPVTATIAGSTTICSGTSTILTFTGTSTAVVSYTINAGAIQTINLGATGIATFSTGNLTSITTYSLTAAALPSCVQTLTSSAIVTISGVPPVTSFTYSSPVCLNSASNPTPLLATSFTTGGTFSAPAGVDINSSTGEIDLSISTAGTYVVSYSLAASACSGAVTSYSTITLAPVATMTSTASTAVCSGSAVNISLTSSTPATYSWIAANNTNISGESTTTQTTATLLNTLTSSVFSSQVVTYSVTPVTSLGCVGPVQTVLVTVNPIATVTVPVNISQCAGTTISSTTFTSTVSPVTYTWTNSNTAIGLGASGTGNIASFTAANATASPITSLITVTPSSTCTGIPSTYTITVNPLPTLVATATANSICVGETTTLTATGGSTYTWTPSGSLSPSAGSTVSASPTTSTTYQVTAIAVGGCSTFTSLPITVNPVVTVTINGTTSICSGTTTVITFTGTPNALLTYTINGANQNIVLNGSGIATTETASLTSTTTYTLTKASNGICSEDYNINAIVSITPATPPVTSFTYTSPVCVNGTNPSPILDPSFTPGGVFSSDAGLSINSSTGDIDLSQTTPSTYIVTYTFASSSCNAGGLHSYSITVNPLATMTSSSAETICSGQELNISLTSTIAATYSWQAIDNANTNGESTSAQTTTTLINTLTNTTISQQVITYTVIPTTAAGCVGPTQTIFVSVNPLTTITSASTAELCTGNAFSISLTSNVPSTYSWIAFDNTNTTGESLSAQSSSTLSNTLTNSTSAIQIVTYTVTPTTIAGGCAGIPQEVVVTVNPLPVLTATSSSAAVCPGASTTLSASGASTYTWSPSGNLSAPSGASVTATPASSTTYTLTGVSTANCSNTTTISIDVTPVPTMTSASTEVVCSGDEVSIALSSTSAVATYTWIASDNAFVSGESTVLQSTATLLNTLTNSTSSIQIVTYTVTPYIGTCNGPEQTVLVSVNPLTTITSASTAELCTGNSFSISLTSNVPSTYSWIAFDNTNTTGESLSAQSSATLSNTLTNSTTAIQVVTYTVTPTTIAGGCAGIPQEVVVTVNPLPVLTATSSSAAVCPGASTTLTATGASTYTWSTSVSLSAPTGASVTATPTSSTTYTIIGVSSANCSNTTTVFVAVTPVPTMTSASSDLLCSGDEVNITLTSTSATATYTWIAINNSNVSGESVLPQATSTLLNTLTNETATIQLVSYTVTPFEGTCAGADQTVLVSVNPVASITSVASAEICTGNSFSIALTSNVPSTYTWVASSNTNVLGESLITQNSATISNTLVNNTSTVQLVSYTVTPTSLAGCLGTPQEVVVTVNPLPTLLATATQANICPGSSTNLSVSGASTYTWSPASTLNVSSGSSVIASPTVNTTYTIIGISASGCSTFTTLPISISPVATATIAGNSSICPGASAVVSFTGTPSATVTYTINSGANQTIVLSALGNATLNTGTLASTTNYDLVGVSNVTCSQAQTGRATVSIIPAVSPITGFSYPTPVCKNISNVAPSVSAGFTSGGIYSSQPGLSISNSTGLVNVTNSTLGNYIVSYTVAASGCNPAATFSSAIKIADLPVITFSEVDQDICSGQSSPIDVFGAQNYVWSPTSSLINFTPTGTSVFAIPTVTTTYEVFGTSIDGCTSKNQISINVTLQSTADAGIDDTICFGESIKLKATGGNKYTWSYHYTLSDLEIATPTATPLNTTKYVVNVSNDGKCASNDTVLITITPLPVLNAGNDTTIYSGEQASLKATVPASVTYSWLYNSDLSCIDCLDPNTSPVYDSNYILLGENKFGCKNSDSVYVFVDEDFGVYIPNTFTPNLDGKNEVFMPKPRGVKEYSLQIFNRWGDLIFESNDYKTGWNGTYKGSLAQDGVYVFIVKIENYRKKKVEKTGSVNLIR